VQERDNEYEMVARRPSGLRKKDLHVEVHDNVLTISGERSRRRRRGQQEEYIAFSRSISLPDDVDGNNVRAYYDEDQALHIVLPKAQGKGPRRIPISAQGQQPLQEECQAAMDTGAGGAAGTQPPQQVKDVSMQAGGAPPAFPASTAATSGAEFGQKVPEQAIPSRDEMKTGAEPRAAVTGI
jgi:hypothetical protein